MGFLPYYDGDDDDDDETGPIGTLGNIRRGTLLEVVLDGDRAIYGDEIDAELGSWRRTLPARLLGRRHAWDRFECHTKDGRIVRGNALVVAEFPFAGRRRYRTATFRPALTKQRKPHFNAAFENKIEQARKVKRTDLVTIAIDAVEDPTLLPLDPFNTGKKRIAGVLPSTSFGDELRDHGRRRRSEVLTGWAFGTCHDLLQVHRRVQLDLFQRIQVESSRQAAADKVPDDGLLRFAYPPSMAFRGRRRLSERAQNAVDGLVEHASWQAMAGLGPKEKMPKDRLVAEVAFRRLNDLLYNLSRRKEGGRSTAKKKPSSKKAPRTRR